MNCANCYSEKHCKTKNDEFVSGCPTKDPSFIERSNDAYDKTNTRDFFLESLRNVAEGYDISSGKKVACKNRLEEIIGFCHRMKYKKIGIAFCTAFEKEVKQLDKILRDEGFDTVSAICKVGGIEKENAGLEETGKIMPGTSEITCNPIGQAIVLNDNKTDFNIVVGLCLGHDSLFLKQSDAPATVFIVKDRVLGHNPIQALRQTEN